MPMLRWPVAALWLALTGGAAMAADPIMPDPSLTPGAVLSVDRVKVCVHGYSATVRHTSAKVKAGVYRAYGLTASLGHYEIDHLIPLSLGGADVPANLWPESYSGEWNAILKDRLEVKMLREVCDEGADLIAAQDEIATDWITAYRKRCPTATACPSYGSRVD